MQWILDHIETVLAVVAFLVAGFKAYKAGTLNTFLVTRIEGLAKPEDKAAIKAEAVSAGIQGALGKAVANAGLSSTKKPAGLLGKAIGAILPLFLGAVLLGGCAAADAGKASTSVTVTFPEARFDNGATVTITSTVTPTSTSSGQTPTNTVSPPVNVSGVPHP